MPVPIYIFNEDNQYFKVQYNDNGDPTKKAALEAKWKVFSRPDPVTNQSIKIWYRPTARNLEAQVDHLLPPTTPPGRYRIETFIPGKHATSRKAVFTIANNFRTEKGQPAYDDTVVLVNMYDLYDVWYSLGEFDLNPSAHSWSGRVRQYDMSLEDPPAEVAFGPIRWVPLFSGPRDTPLYDPPIGTDQERQGPFGTGAPAFGLYPTWCGAWYDVNPYLSWYIYGYHTGADLNLPGSSDADKGKPIYAIGDGKVIYAGPAGNWGNIVVVEHPNAIATLPSGTVQRQMVYSRYGHVDDRIQVKKDQLVQRGQLLAYVGLPAKQVTGWHLHFDISYTDRLRLRPSHWPDLTRIRELKADGVSTSDPKFIKAQAAVKAEVVAHYLDPFRFMKDNHG